MQIPVLYENEWLLVVNKPAGIQVEASIHGYPSIESWARQYLSANSKKPSLVGIVHRLDRSVSGVLVLAKKKAALQQLNAQWAQRQVKKVYLALVEKVPAVPEGMLVHYLKRNTEGKKALIFDTPVKNAAMCRLDYQIVAEKKGGFLLKVQLHTGKFHQIRAQLAHIGCPILGDALYRSTSLYRQNAIALHAWQLECTDPLTQKLICIEAHHPFEMFD